MGVVYKVFDCEFGVFVVFKVIFSDSSNFVVVVELNVCFKRELLFVCEVMYFNVVCIYDLGDFDGMKYFIMSYVDGEDLLSLFK